MEMKNGAIQVMVKNRKVSEIDFLLFEIDFEVDFEIDFAI